jgi:hypothetical protein
MGDLPAAAAVLGVLGVVVALENAWDFTRRGVLACLENFRSTLSGLPRK